MPSLSLALNEAMADWRLKSATAGLLMNRQVVAAGPHASSLDLILRMGRFNVDILPIVDTADRVLGIVSRGDIVRRSDFLCVKHCLARRVQDAPAAQSWADYLATGGKPARLIMTPDVIAVDESTPLATLHRLMEGHRIGCLPVLCQDRLVGLVTRTDLGTPGARPRQVRPSRASLPARTPDMPWRFAEADRWLAC
ncbi:CBS domain-containing protein [Arboricoccus pini]|uniref:CBS domain-containing protein n=1 Tax=Arboricoccus pini TaxID=1963835 RepID=A0A212RS20_9PROT|nr:CBS domain-containing protein [Arboricoccus pini]SNB75428.1 CBS domain-containing protein [Arboricoccus pini]